MAQRQIPGGPFIDEVGTAQRQIPGGPFVNETAAAAGGTPTLSDLQAASITATTVQGTYDYTFA